MIMTQLLVVIWGLYPYIILLSHEKGPMGGAPYVGLKQGGGPTFKLSILCSLNALSGNHKWY